MENARPPAAWTVVRAYRKLRDRSLTHDGKWLVGIGMILGMFILDVRQPVYVLWCALFGMGLSSLLMGRLRRVRVSVERSIPQRVTAGTTVGYSAIVTSKAAVTQADLEVREEDLPWEVWPVLEDGRGAPIRRLSPGESRRVRLQAEFLRRGVYDLGGVRVERVCPLGLTRYGVTAGGRARVIVHPPHVAIERIDFSDARVYQPGGIPLSASVGESTEFVGLRDYRSGDPLRHISWKTWARTGEPVVREFQGEYFRRVAVVLDTRVRSGRDEEDHFEAAVSLAASVVRHFETHEFVIDLFAAGPRLYYLRAGNGLARMEDVLDLLACVEAGTGDRLPSVDDGLRQLVNRLSGVVLVGTDWWPESREFHARLLPEVPEVKVLIVRPDRPTLDPARDVTDPRLLGVVAPDRVAMEGLEL